ncbi:SRPBCC domain-containing protein [candidate division KSB1 bacterium]|nr:SRPBCC domain-containing protein [candidate division KSB1 bacterium]
MDSPSRSGKQTGKTRDAVYQAGARRTMPLRLEKAWELITSQDAVKIWLGDSPDINFVTGATYHLPDDTTGQVRVFKPGSHLRMTWQPREWLKPSTLQVRVIPNGDKTVIAFHQENLPGPEKRRQGLAFFKTVLDRLERLIHSE